jgi:hypothetical protein
MYNWLRTGHQKELLGEDSTCPCCWKKVETQLHIFKSQSGHDSSTQVRHSIHSLHQHLREKHIPPISGCLIELCTSLFEQQEPCLDMWIPIIELFTRGFLSSSWIQAIQFFTNDKVEQKAKVIVIGPQSVVSYYFPHNGQHHQKERPNTTHFWTSRLENVITWVLTSVITWALTSYTATPYILQHIRHEEMDCPA